MQVLLQGLHLLLALLGQVDLAPVLQPGVPFPEDAVGEEPLDSNTKQSLSPLYFDDFRPCIT